MIVITLLNGWLRVVVVHLEFSLTVQEIKNRECVSVRKFHRGDCESQKQPLWTLMLTTCMGPTCIERREKEKGWMTKRKSKVVERGRLWKEKSGQAVLFTRKRSIAEHTLQSCTTNVIATMLAVFTRSRPLFRWIYTKSIKIWNI